MDHFLQHQAEAKLRERLSVLDNETGSRFATLFDQVLTARFDEGFQLAAAVEQRAARTALQQYVLDVLGKDRADGPIDLGALGESVFHEPRTELRCSVCSENRQYHVETGFTFES